MMMICILSFLGCIHEPEFKIPELEILGLREEATSDIETVINAFKQAETNIYSFDSAGNIIVSAYVISSDEAGNFYKTLIIQDSPESPNKGLELKIDMKSYFTKYNFGRKILLRLSGLSIEEQRGKFVVGYLSGNSLREIPESLLDQFIMRTPETVEITPKQINLEAVVPDLINTYVAIEQAQFLRADLGKSFASEAYDKYNGERLIEQCDNLAKCYLFTSAYADFSTSLLPEQRFGLKAVLTSDLYSGEITFILNNTDDIDLADEERCDPDFFECTIESIPEKEDVIFYENFQKLVSSRDIEKIGWNNINVNFGNGRFKKRSSDENTYVQISAYGSGEYVMEVWLISPEIDLDGSENEFLSFDTRATFEEGSLLTAWVSTDYLDSFTDATWQQLDGEVSVGSNGSSNKQFQSSGSVQLHCLEGKIRIAFRYLGSDPGASTTYDLDNILILGDKKED